MRVSRISRALIACLAGLGTAAQASDMTYFTTVPDTDVATFAIGRMRNYGNGELVVSGLSGTISSAYLYWHGPTNSIDPKANAATSFAGHAITGTNIGFSQDNLWSYANSQAYRADVTALVTGNGSYYLDGFINGFGGATANINGASLIVFYQDGDATNNRDVVLFDGNDSNFDNSYDANGWNATLAGIDYTSGSASMTLSISDGQSVFTDGELMLNGTTIANGNWARGDSVQPGDGIGRNGYLWDIQTYDVTGFLVPGSNTLDLKLAPVSDALSLIVAQFSLPVGAAPPAPSPVPEPASWAMFIGGFGLIGGAMRRRRVSVRFG
ncbi:PEPxxWA-CTERM sorting domain-containing protein [Sphingomonas sp. AP4-R1]|uniref:PEPxxWA-CTERM sorting domain-containing protein n=1 Tax=Sphingomonas sp. AP4-R1 TaxID=2735134 RepID=UPI0020A30237|nr:PEPxxWA-CTERM sorting domain-containing protein [Sphingomonas sp. AP4-R1]